MNPKVFQFFDALTLASPVILFIGMILGFVYYRRLDALHRWLHFFLIMALLVDIASRILGEVYHNNLILIPIYGLLELLIFTYIYFTFLLRVKYKLWIISIAIVVLFNLYEIFQSLHVDPKDFNSHSRVVDYLVIVIMSIVFYIHQIATANAKSSSIFFLNTVILLFYSLNLILYLPLNFLINEASDIKFHFWTVSLVLTLIFYISIVRTIWIHGKNHKP